MNFNKKLLCLYRMRRKTWTKAKFFDFKSTVNFYLKFLLEESSNLRLAKFLAFLYITIKKDGNTLRSKVKIYKQKPSLISKNLIMLKNFLQLTKV